MVACTWTMTAARYFLFSAGLFCVRLRLGFPRFGNDHDLGFIAVTSMPSGIQVHQRKVLNAFIFPDLVDGGGYLVGQAGCIDCACRYGPCFPCNHGSGKGDVRIAWMDARAANGGMDRWNVYYRSSTNGGRVLVTRVRLSHLRDWILHIFSRMDIASHSAIISKWTSMNVGRHMPSGAKATATTYGFDLVRRESERPQNKVPAQRALFL